MDDMPDTHQGIIPPRDEEQMPVATAEDGMQVLRNPLYGKCMFLNQRTCDDETRIP